MICLEKQKCKSKFINLDRFRNMYSINYSCNTKKAWATLGTYLPQMYVLRSTRTGKYCLKVNKNSQFSLKYPLLLSYLNMDSNDTFQRDLLALTGKVKIEIK